MQRHSKLIPLGAVLALVASSAFAQTAAPAMPASASTPATVGVAPRVAAEALQKAVPRNDTGTLVRTTPAAADKAKAAMDNTTSSSTNSTPSSTTAAPSSATTMPMDDAAKPAPMRRARADRN